MSLKDIRSECSDVASLLQPHVDGELEDDERERVAEHLSACTPCRAAVQEQLWVRATLRAIERDAAPQALRARILAGLDEIDLETSKSAEPRGWSLAWSRMRDVLRGGFVMVPAGAVAAALFWVARSGIMPTEPTMTPGVGLGAAAVLSGIEHEKPIAERPPDADVLDALAEVEPKVGFPVQVARPGTSDSVQLVSARVDPAPTAAPNADRLGAQLRYKMVWQGQPAHVLDHQLPAGTQVVDGTPVSFGGRQYLLSRSSDGRPVLSFERSGVAHMLTLEGPGGDVRSLTRAGAEPDYSLLLHFAEHSFSH
jgi:anti-sigma factor (TIGR02949 family)